MIAIRSILVVFACVCLVASAGASAAVELKVARKGSYVYWLSYTDASGSEQITLPQRFKGTGTQIDTKVLGRKYSDARLYVMDRTTGNMAVTDLASAEDGPAPIELAADDFQYVRCVRLRIVSEDNRPLERAVVTITDGMNTRMRSVVTPADEGVEKDHRLGYHASGEARDAGLRAGCQGCRRRGHAAGGRPDRGTGRR